VGCGMTSSDGIHVVSAGTCLALYAPSFFTVTDPRNFRARGILGSEFVILAGAVMVALQGLT